MSRSKALLFPAVLLVAFIVAVAASPAHSASQGSKRQLLTLNRGLVAAINAYRAQHNLTALTVSTDLNAAALQHSMEMGTYGYFAHSSYDGTPFWKRIQTYYTSTDYSYWTAGENLLYMSPTVSAAKALKMWIASPEHKRNLLSKDWLDVGVSAVKVAHAPGVYGGYTVTIVTCDFGARH
jgi:uncharacterized protein YkwD